MAVSVRVEGLDRIQYRLERRMGRRALNEALAKGVNATANAVKGELIEGMKRTLDRPTPFTLRAIKISQAKASKPPPNAMVFVQPVQGRYLRYPIRGGTLRSIITPAAKRLNRYGNIPGKLKGLEGIKGSSPKRFIGEINGKFGVWERHGAGGRRVKPLVLVKRNQERTARFDFDEIAMTEARGRLRSDVLRELREALRG